MPPRHHVNTSPKPPASADVNFTGVSPEQLLERMIELSLYAEEKLKSS
jgi:hypothetical protein